MRKIFIKPRLRTLFALIVFTAGVTFGVFHSSQIMGISIQLADIPKNDGYQMYFDTGKGYNERLSDNLRAFPSETPTTLHFSFPVPASHIKSVRLDLGTGPGTHTVKRISFTHEFLFYPVTLVEWEGGHLAGVARPLHSIASISSSGSATTTIVASGRDPYFEFAFDQSSLLASAAPRSMILLGFLWIVLSIIAAIAVYRYDLAQSVIRGHRSRNRSKGVQKSGAGSAAPSLPPTPGRTAFRTATFYIVTACMTLSVLYILVETYAQLYPRYHRFQEGASFKVGLNRFLDGRSPPNLPVSEYLEQRSAEPNKYPLLGWDADPQIFTNHFSNNRDEGGTSPGKSIVILGDSVAQGLTGVEPSKSFPALLASDLHSGARVINLAVAGYGIDQMALKAMYGAPSYNPDLIVFAFIPHDILRTGADFIYDRPKPKLRIANDALTINGPTSPARFYLDYYRNRQRFTLSFWLLNHYLDNKEFFFPTRNTSYYASIAELVSRILGDLSKRLDVPVLITKLTNTTRYPGLQELEDAVIPVFRSAADENAMSLHFIDMDSCTRKSSEQRGVRVYNTFYAHPGAPGHEIYAECLMPVIDRLMK